MLSDRQFKNDAERRYREWIEELITALWREYARPNKAVGKLNLCTICGSKSYAVICCTCAYDQLVLATSSTTARNVRDTLVHIRRHESNAINFEPTDLYDERLKKKKT